MEKNKIYKLKECDLNELNTIFDLNPVNSNPFVLVVFREKMDIVKWLLKTYYENKDWIENVYKKNEDFFKKEFGIQYRENGELKFNKKVFELIKTWILESDFGNKDKNDKFYRSLYLRPMDPYTNVEFYNTEILDKYCGEIIKKLKEKDLIIEETVE